METVPHMGKEGDSRCARLNACFLSRDLEKTAQRELWLETTWDLNPKGLWKLSLRCGFDDPGCSYPLEDVSMTYVIGSDFPTRKISLAPGWREGGRLVKSSGQVGSC